MVVVAGLALDPSPRAKKPEAADEDSGSGKGEAVLQNPGTIVAYASPPQILLAQAGLPGPSGTSAASPISPVSSPTLSEGELLLTEVSAAIEQSIFTRQNGSVGVRGYFLRVAGTETEPVYYIESPTQFGQIVSEGMAYWLQILSTITFRLDLTNEKDQQTAKRYYDVAKGLIRGALSMLNKKGNIGWRCFYEGDKIVFRSNDELTSATDADLIFVGALMNFEKLENQMFDKKIISQKAKFDIPKSARERADKAIIGGKKERDFPLKGFASIGELIDFMAQGIKSFDVEKLEYNSSDPNKYRLVLRVSDDWGGEDLKGNITSNSSYYRPVVLWQLAKRFQKDADFWLQLRHDEFKKLEASYDFVHELATEIVQLRDNSLTDKQWIRLDGPQARLFDSMARKIPSDEREKDPKILKLVSDNCLDVDGDSFIFVLDKSIIHNNDGSRDIRADVFNLMIEKILQYGIDRFLPDQVEVETDETGKFIVRREVGAKNLDFIEGYDAIRIYAELGEDYLFIDDSRDSSVKQQYKISSDIAIFLEQFTEKKNPKAVRADRYHNSIALSCYMMAAAAVQKSGNGSIHDGYLSAMQDYFRTPTVFDFITTASGRTSASGAQYYNASLSLRLMTSFLAREKDITPAPFTQERPTLERLTRETGLSYQYALHHEDADFALRAFANDAETVLSPSTKEPIMKIEAERRYHHFKRTLNPNSITSRFDFANACLGVGRYDEAKVVLFELIRDAKDLSGVASQRILQKSITSLTDILRTLSVSDIEVEDLFAWLIEQEKNTPGMKLSMLRLAYIKELNSNGRLTRAIDQETKLLEELAAPMSSGARALEWLQGRALSGKKVSNQPPRIELIADALAETAYSIASTYTMGEDLLPDGKPSNFPHRVYNYRDGLILAARILGKDHAIVKILQAAGLIAAEDINEQKLTSPDAIKLAASFSALQDIVPKDLQSHVALSVCRITRRRIYDLRDYVEVRYFTANPWETYWTYGDDLPKRMGEFIGEYQKIINACDLSLQIYEETFKTEVQKLENPLIITGLLDGRFSCLLAKIDALSEKERQRMDLYNRVRLPYDQKETRDRQNIFTQIVEIRKPFDYAFSHPLETKAAEKVKRTRTGSIDEAAQIIVDAEGSVDPRNVNWIRWIRQIAEVHAIAGLRSRDARKFGTIDRSIILKTFPEIASILSRFFENPNEELLIPKSNIQEVAQREFPDLKRRTDFLSLLTQNQFELALNLYAQIPETYVSSRSLRALYIIQTCVKMAETYYFYRRVLTEQKQNLAGSDPKRKSEIEKMIEEQKQEMVNMLNALLGTHYQATHPTERARQINIYIDEYRDSIDKLFEDDPTLQSRIYAALGNFLWWGEQESATATGRTKKIDSLQIEQALQNYREALSRDPYNIDALVGSSLLLFNAGNEKAALLFFVRALRAVGSKYVPQARLFEIASLVSMLSNPGPSQVSIENKFTPEQIEALIAAQRYLDSKKGQGELTSWDIERLVEIFRMF